MKAHKLSEEELRRIRIIHDGEEVERCRKVRQELFDSFPNLDALLDYAESVTRMKPANLEKDAAKNTRVPKAPKLSEEELRRIRIIHDGEDVERCRQVRRDLEKQFPTVEALLDYCDTFKGKKKTVKPKGTTKRATVKK